jgi:membrane protease YdiL (CAAX protease family)
MKGAGKMKKVAILIVTSVILMIWISSVYAGQILGYPIAPKQAKFYTIILSVIGVSMALVGTAYFSFWLADLKKKKTGVGKAFFSRRAEAFAGKLAIVPQAAK